MNRYDELLKRDDWLSWWITENFKTQRNFLSELDKNGMKRGLSIVSLWVRENELPPSVLGDAQQLHTVAKTLDIPPGILLRLHGLDGAIDSDIPPEAEGMIALARDAREKGLMDTYNALTSAMTLIYNSVKANTKS